MAPWKNKKNCSVELSFLLRIKPLVSGDLTPSCDMGRTRNLTESFHEFSINCVDEEDRPGVAAGDDGYDRSIKLGLLLLKEEINKSTNYRRMLSYIFDTASPS